MASLYKVLGQSNPSATTETVLYTVPNSINTVASSLIVCNTGSTQASFRVSISINSVTTAIKNYIYYDLLIGGNDTFIATIGVTLSNNYDVRVYASSSNLAFSLYGSEIS